VAAAALAMRFPQARVLALDLVPEMLDAGRSSGWLGLCADAASLPLADGSVDLVFSNLMLPCCESPPAVLAEVGRVLRHPGLFSFTTFGPDTLRELRSAWAEVDRHSHVPDFQDMHNIGDALLQAGFAEPVVDAERLTITYPDLSRLAADLRAAGAVNLTPERNRGLTGRRTRSRLLKAYDHRRDAQGRLPVTVEVIYGQAWAAPPREAAGPPGEFTVPVGRIGRRR
jgi:malonyl-CoA O-methyltransferase